LRGETVPPLPVTTVQTRVADATCSGTLTRSFAEDSLLPTHHCGKADQRRELAYYEAGSARVTVAIESGATLTISEASSVLPAFVPLINT
jgi:hypothetical protein